MWSTRAEYTTPDIRCTWGERRTRGKVHPSPSTRSRCMSGSVSCAGVFIAYRPTFGKKWFWQTWVVARSSPSSYPFFRCMKMRRRPVSKRCSRPILSIGLSRHMQIRSLDDKRRGDHHVWRPYGTGSGAMLSWADRHEGEMWEMRQTWAVMQRERGQWRILRIDGHQEGIRHKQRAVL